MNLGKDYQGMGRYMALGIQMVVVTAIGAGIGFWLDKKTGKAPVFLAVCFLLGAFGGIACVWRAINDDGSSPKQ